VFFIIPPPVSRAIAISPFMSGFLSCKGLKEIGDIVTLTNKVRGRAMGKKHGRRPEEELSRDLSRSENEGFSVMYESEKAASIHRKRKSSRPR
jgi:hypothetical protein